MTFGLQFERLFQPGQIGTMEVKNRIVMAPMGQGAMQNPDGGFSERLRDYYEARAKGGVGLIMTGATLMTRVTNTELRRAGATLFLDSTYVGGASEVCDAVHRYGAKMCLQLTPGEGRLWSYGGEVPVAPTAGLRGVWNPKVVSRAATIEEIEKIVKDYGYVARLAKLAGFDAIEIRAYGGYFTDQFMSAIWNKRTDKYGGDLDSRLRFLMETIAVVRKAVGRDYPIIVKFTPAHYVSGGRELEEGLEIARRLEDAGVDALHVDKGCYEVWYHGMPSMHMPLANQIELAEVVKKVVKIPIIAHGKLGVRPEIAEKVLEEGETDFIALGRSLLADPEWVNKVAEGRLKEIKPCIGCMWGCLKRIFEGKYISCAVNPQTGMEREYQLAPAQHRKSVLVIGAGPGGMEAARVAALRGNTVTLYEKEMVLGGALRLASAPSFKKQIQMLIDYYSYQLPALGVRMQLGKNMDADSILQRKADAVIIAVGASPVVPEQISGITRGNVYTVEDVLLGKIGVMQLGKNVVIVGGGEIGCEIALHLAETGSNLNIAIIEMLEQIMTDSFISVKLLLEQRLKDSGIQTLCNTRLLKVGEMNITIKREGLTTEMPADSVVVAMGYQGNTSLGKELKRKVVELYLIGDGKKPGRVLDAIWDGFHVGRIV